ncbi:C39 family peptidase [Methylacidiphilales bacterium]|nr:C39 family peptidase [Candidatus Methylacidiphilales bacterium]
MKLPIFMRRRWLTLAVLVLIPHIGWSDSALVTVTITAKAPVETLSLTGGVTGVKETTVGDHFIFVSIQGDRLILQDSQGTRYRIAQTATDYMPGPAPMPAPTSSFAATNAAAAVSSPVPATNTTPVPTDSSISSSTPSPAVAPTSTASISDDALATINTGLGKPFFSAQNFWQESALLVANRLGLKLEDKTKWETSYRRYFYDRQYRNYAPVKILGGDAYCVALYADANDAPTSALIAFTNDGDYQDTTDLQTDIYRLQHPSDAPLPNADKQIAELQAKFNSIRQSFEATRAKEQVTLTQNLTALFGDPQKTSFGSDAITREDALRWDWNGISFLLTCEENKYNLLRIIPTSLADNHGRTERIPRDELGAKLTDAVEHRPNGDVVITQLPMADQGLKGYCVPATWERVLRYTGVPGDMYTLSRIGNAGFGGGENGIAVAAQLDSTLHDYGRRASLIRIGKIDAFSLSRYIDSGIPVFWVVNTEGYTPVTQRYALCDRDQDWDEWKKLLDQSRIPSTTKPDPLPYYGSHQVLITGYNPETKEIAWSDPWGRSTQERWMTQEEAERCSLKEFYVITW